MARRVFFSMHYQDIIDFRANVVRNHWRLKPNRDISGYYDASIWESAKRQGKIALKRLINKGLDNTSNTCVLIGSQTYQRPWVRYELLKSFKKGNNIFGVHINSIKGRNQRTKSQGLNPLAYVGVTYSNTGKIITLWEKNNGEWVEYKEIDGNSSYNIGVAVERKYRGKGYHLGNFFKTYDWIRDGGYRNFSGWVDQ